MSFWRTWLYHRDFPKGKIFDFETEDEANETLAAGWKDSPGKIDEPVLQVEEVAIVEPITVEIAAKEEVAVVKTTTEKPVAPPKKPRAPGRPFKKVKGGK